MCEDSKILTIDTILDKLLGSNLKRSLSLFDEATGQTILDVGKLRYGSNSIKSMSVTYLQTLSVIHCIIRAQPSTRWCMHNKTHLNTGVANRTSSQLMPARTAIINLRGENSRISSQNTLVSINVHADVETGNLSGLLCGSPKFNQVGDRGGEAGCETAGGHHGNVHLLRRHGWIDMFV